MGEDAGGGRAAVIGGGTMGAGIAQVLLEAGCEVTGLDAPLDVELVVEAIPEFPDAKRDLLAAAEKVTPPEALLASNTSSLSITELAGALQRPERFLGMHFFNPVPLSALVELVVGESTAQGA